MLDQCPSSFPPNQLIYELFRMFHLSFFYFSLIGSMVYAFHQWKFGRKKKDRQKKKASRSPRFPPEYLDENFAGNTYIHNNIFLPTVFRRLTPFKLHLPSLMHAFPPLTPNRESECRCPLTSQALSGSEWSDIVI